MGNFLAAWTELPTPSTGVVQFINFTQVESHIEIISRGNDGRSVSIRVPVVEFRAMIAEAGERLA